ncbi:MAG: BON domain-containing protein [Polyangiaceae bacterium]|nr:BON domain-containing protein [Polyangiaceae bacterium]
MNRSSNGLRNSINGISNPRNSTSDVNRESNGRPYDPSFRARWEQASLQAAEARARWEQYEREWAAEHGYNDARRYRGPFGLWRGRDENHDFWGRPRSFGRRTLGERISEIFGASSSRVEQVEQKDERWERERARSHQLQGQAQARIWNRMKDAFVGRGPKNYVRSDDRIREEVCERLTYHPYVDAYDVEVTVRNGEVTLSGTIDDRRSKRLAEDVAGDVVGVRDVHNELHLNPPE